MADVSAARTKAVFEFKSATLPLIAVILKTTDLGVLAEALDAQLADSPDFFEQEPVVIDLSQLPEASAEAGALAAAWPDGLHTALRRACAAAAQVSDEDDAGLAGQGRAEGRVHGLHGRARRPNGHKVPQRGSPHALGHRLRQRELALQAVESRCETRRAGRTGRLGARRARDGDAVPA